MDYESTAELTQLPGVQPTQITKWKQQPLGQALSVSERRQTKANTVEVDEL